MTYTLNITIDPTSVAHIQAAQQYVTIVQSVQTYAQTAFSGIYASVAAPTLATAWLSIGAMQNTTLTWSPADYQLYATPAAPANGVILQLNATTDAIQSQVYPYQSNLFGNPTAVSDAGYFVKNLQADTSSPTTFGMAVAATLDGMPQKPAAITAITALQNEIVWLQPSASVAVFLSSISTGGTVFHCFGDPVYYAMSGTGTVNLTFNASNSTFIPTTSAVH